MTSYLCLCDCPRSWESSIIMTMLFKFWVIPNSPPTHTLEHSQTAAVITTKQGEVNNELGRHLFPNLHRLPYSADWPSARRDPPEMWRQISSQITIKSKQSIQHGIVLWWWANWASASHCGQDWGWSFDGNVQQVRFEWYGDVFLQPIFLFLSLDMSYIDPQCMSSHRSIASHCCYYHATPQNGSNMCQEMHRSLYRRWISSRWNGMHRSLRRQVYASTRKSRTSSDSFRKADGSSSSWRAAKQCTKVRQVGGNSSDIVPQ